MNNNTLVLIALVMPSLPLLGSLIAGLIGKKIGNLCTHRIAISLVAIAFVLACYLFNVFVIDAHLRVDQMLYTWATAGLVSFDIGFLLDRLSIVMSVIVLFISLIVHIYTIGYMKDDPGYTRFFSYVSLFTFAMLLLVLANNFLSLFVGWEGVGLVSYLLIGFWFKRESAVNGGLKAFLVNRLGDVGFILALGLVLMFFGTLTYTEVFTQAPYVLDKSLHLFLNIVGTIVTSSPVGNIRIL